MRKYAAREREKQADRQADRQTKARELRAMMRNGNLKAEIPTRIPMWGRSWALVIVHLVE